MRYEITAAFEWPLSDIDDLEWDRFYKYWIDARAILKERKEALDNGHKS